MKELDEFIILLRDKTPDERVAAIIKFYNINVVKEEVHPFYPDRLKDIILGRGFESCPNCGGIGFINLIDKEKCPDCTGKGLISGTALEKIVLKKLLK